jgi:hypothetical protein
MLQGSRARVSVDNTRLALYAGAHRGPFAHCWWGWRTGVMLTRRSLEVGR